MTDVAMEDVYAHGAQGQPGCCKPTVAVTHLLSSLSQLKLPHQTTGQCEEQILENNTKKCCMLVSAVRSTKSHSNNKSLCSTNKIQGELLSKNMISSHVKISPLLCLPPYIINCTFQVVSTLGLQKMKHYMTSWSDARFLFEC